MAIIRLERVILATLCAGVLLAIPSAAAAQTSTFVIPFERVGDPELDDAGVPIPNTGAFINPCTAEAVDVTGVSTVTISQSIDKNGDVRTNVGEVTKGLGIAQVSLVKYAFSDNQQFTLRIPAMGTAFESTFTDKFALKGFKSIDNWTIRATFRVKISATGEVLVNLVRMTGDVCRG
jgi:hypothetical protein